MTRFPVRPFVAALGAALLAACSDNSSDAVAVVPPITQVEDRAYYILPPGNFGGLPPT